MNTATKENMTAETIIAQAKIDNPGKRFAIYDNPDHTDKRIAIAFYSDKHNRWEMIAGKTITGEWMQIGDLCVNGEPLHKQEFWVEV